MVGRILKQAIVLTISMSAALLPPRSVSAGGLPQPLFSLPALLTMSPDLPAMARSVLVSEAERIWRREGVALHWSAARGHEAPTATLRILVISRREALGAGTDSEWTIGELVPHAGQRALAIASIAGAERVLEASGARLHLLDNPELARYRLGLVLGRAVAHEIGHYLLATPTHADRGLMRAAIDAREFADPGARTFTLDQTAGDWVRTRLLDSQSIDRPLPSTGFTYARPSDTPGSALK